MQTHDGFALVQIPEFVAGNGHAVRLTRHAARACEGVSSFVVVLGICAVAINVTHGNILPPSCLLVNKKNEVFFVVVSY